MIKGDRVEVFVQDPNDNAKGSTLTGSVAFKPQMGKDTVCVLIEGKKRPKYYLKSRVRSVMGESEA